MEIVSPPLRVTFRFPSPLRNVFLIDRSEPLRIPAALPQASIIPENGDHQKVGDCGGDAAPLHDSFSQHSCGVDVDAPPYFRRNGTNRLPMLTSTAIDASPLAVLPINLPLERIGETCGKPIGHGSLIMKQGSVSVPVNKNEAANGKSLEKREVLVSGEGRSHDSSLTLNKRPGESTSAATCAPKRRRSSAVRDYPVGCGKNAALNYSLISSLRAGVDSSMDKPAKSPECDSRIEVPGLGQKTQKSDHGNADATLHENDYKKIRNDGAICLYRNGICSQHAGVANCSFQCKQEKDSNGSPFPSTGMGGFGNKMKKTNVSADVSTGESLPSVSYQKKHYGVIRLPRSKPRSPNNSFELKKETLSRAGPASRMEKTDISAPDRSLLADSKEKKHDRTSCLYGHGISGQHASGIHRQKNSSHAMPAEKGQKEGNYGHAVRSDGSEQIHNDKTHLRNELNLSHPYTPSPVYGSEDGTNCEDSPKKRISEQRLGVSARSLVKQTLREFESVRRELLKLKRSNKRPDLEAAGILKRRGRWRNCGAKIIGEVPGVEVGDVFTYRIEMLLIGLHRQVQGGIDSIPSSQCSRGGPFATSIVASGGYEDDDDGGDTFIYTGQGGNNYRGDKRQEKDQKLVRGNLALRNSYKHKFPVRVIRGSQDLSSPTEKAYTYDGLYDVVDYWFQPGLSGFGVYQFKLTRQAGQPELGSTIVKFVGNLKMKGIARPNLLLEDISEGKERIAVCVVNEVDGELQPIFNYISGIKYPSWFAPELPRGCDCVGGCVDPTICLCAARNGGDFPYNQAGFLIQTKPVVYECGSSCRCSSSCYNRVSQRGLKYQLEIFKTKKKGWGVRSLDSIRSGGFICEYTGELLTDAEAEKRTGIDEYLFDIGNKWNAWGDDVSELLDMSTSTSICPVVEEAGNTIDAKEFGNVARFINHSCSPNLYPQNVLFDCHDLRFPHVMLFAMELIPPMRELSYDYNYSVGNIRDENGNVKTKACHCGALECSGRLY